MRGGVYGIPSPNRERLIRGVHHLHALGPRILAEFLLEATAANDLPDLLRRLDDYRRLTPEIAEKLGATRWTAPVRVMLRRAA